MRSLTYSGISSKGIMYILHNMEPNWLSLKSGHTVSSQIANAITNMNFQEDRAIETCERISHYISTQWAPAVGLPRSVKIMDCMVSEEDVEVPGIGKAKSNYIMMSVPFENVEGSRISITIKQLGMHAEKGTGEVFTNEKIRGGDLRMMPSGVFSITLSYPFHDWNRIAKLCTNLVFSNLRDVDVLVDGPTGMVSIYNKALAAICMLAIAQGIRSDNDGHGGVLWDMAMEREI